MVEPKGRPVGATECSWCRAVPGGTGIAVLALHTSKAPDVTLLQKALHKLQNSHPILKSRLISDTSTNTFSFLTSPTPFVQVKSFNPSSTFHILDNLANKPSNQEVSHFHLILEHELNLNSWHYTRNINGGSPPHNCTDMFFTSIYDLSNSKWVVVLRLHVSACDRTTAVSLLRELLVLIGEGESRGIQMEMGKKGEVNLGIEKLIPSGKAKKPLWAHGVDMLSYSVNSLRLTNLKFKDTRSSRSSEVVRLQLNQNDTERILIGCKLRGIKLCGALVAAGLMAAHKSKNGVDHQMKKYGVVTLTDCRSLLDPPLSTHHYGFYHSAILNTHSIKGGEELWELAKKTYGAFTNSKNSNKHFSDMADLNFLMCKVIDNPALTSSSSLRTSFMSVFEDTVIDNSNDTGRGQVGLEDYMGCSSVHGVGPSIAIFDTIRDGRLDCVCVYPTPLHSREQMFELVHKMKTILLVASQ